MSPGNGTEKNKNHTTIKTDARGTPIIPEGVTVFFLSEIINKPVLLKSGLGIGRLKDIAVKIENVLYPEVTAVVVRRPWGHPDLWLPWQSVADISERQTIVDVSENLEHFATRHDEYILVNEKIIDKKIIDMEDREVEVVYDIQLVYADGKLFLTHVDASQSGLLRRIHLGFLNKWFFGKRESPDLVPWHYVHIPTDLGRLSGQVRLNIQREKLKDIHPVDLADIIEELGQEERIQILESLDTEKAADTLEEIEPRVQREIIKTIRQERIRDIFKSMTPSQLADLLSILPSDESNRLIKNLEPEIARKVRNIINQYEATIASLVSHTYLAFPGNLTVNEAFQRFRREAQDRDVVMYIYIVDEGKYLRGVLDIRELLQAEPDKALKDIMVKNVISVEPSDTKEDVTILFKRYYFRAIPVVDAQDRLIGVVRFKDLFIDQKGPVSAL